MLRRVTYQYLVVLKNIGVQDKYRSEFLFSKALHLYLICTVCILYNLT